MKQRLEEFIQSNRGDFDADMPPSNIWELVQLMSLNKKPKRKTLTLFTFRNIAAAIATLAIAITLFLFLENKRLKEDLTAIENKANNQKNLDENLQVGYDQQIKQFAKSVAFKQNQLSIIKREYPKLYQEFISDIKHLNEEYKSLEEELANVPEKEVLLEAMIQNLRLQAELLNKQLLIIQQLKQIKTHKNEKESPVI